MRRSGHTSTCSASTQRSESNDLPSSPTTGASYLSRTSPWVGRQACLCSPFSSFSRLQKVASDPRTFLPPQHQRRTAADLLFHVVLYCAFGSNRIDTRCKRSWRSVFVPIVTCGVRWQPKVHQISGSAVLGSAFSSPIAPGRWRPLQAADERPDFAAWSHMHAQPAHAVSCVRVEPQGQAHTSLCLQSKVPFFLSHWLKRAQYSWPLVLLSLQDSEAECSLNRRLQHFNQ